MERRLLKVLKGLAEYLDVSLGDLLEGIVLHTFEQKLPFDDADIAIVERLKDVYGLDLTAADSHHLREEREKEVAFDEHRPCTRVSLTGRIEVNLPPDQAFLLFTPSGERTWAHGWDPSFPSPSPDETGLGSVFRTAHGDRESIWTVVRREPGHAIGYAVTTPEVSCGLVTVSCDPSANGTGTTVSYDLTALRSEANAELDRFEENYPSFLAHWERAIATAIEQDDT